MDRKTCLCEAVVKDVKDLMPGKEVDIRVMIPEGLPEEADYVAMIGIEAEPIDGEPVHVYIRILECLKERIG